MSVRAWMLSACAVATLGGCAIGPNYQRPQTPDVAQYRLDTGALAIAADSDWWNQFNDPALNALVDAALAGNYDVRIAAARIDEFRGQLMVARSGFFPQLNLSAAAARQSIGGLGGTQFGSGTGNSYQLLANASWEIDLWGRIRRQAESAEASLWNAEYARRGVVLSLAASVVQGYATLRGLDAQLVVAQQTLASRASGLDIFRQRYEGGVISQLELAQAENDYYVAEGSIPPLRTAIAQTENALSVLLGRPPGPIERGKPIGELQAPPVGADLPAALLSRRPDVLQAEQTAIAANAQLGAAQALYLPAVNLSGLFGAVAASPAALWDSASRVWAFGAGLTQPIFQGGAIRGQVQTASAQREQAMLAYQGTVLAALADVNSALANGVETRTRLGSLRRQEQSLFIYADQAFARYEGGYSSYLEVTNAREKLFDAQLAAIQGQVDVLTGTAALYKSLGGGWPAVPQAVRDAGMQGDAKVLAR
ncbi:component of acridine efflux pump, outer membrane lipoprotein [Cupriavidus taiwanensis]|uniref:Component of acridine efflux pump, outer membrane lipoprotein n=1 Tax=Cupriavidus taiwanensis TaxID=164546 RepID=A0A375BS85_9BURK|nr:efflux transporter outer membrane subunit [Cupriavidus taiwanensis]SOY51614.1 component of acridine efflux pump, outer membrane lipoprotein [Cupriavidus taiwanensis]